MILSVFHKESIANVRNVLIRSAFMKNFIVRSIRFFEKLLAVASMVISWKEWLMALTKDLEEAVQSVRQNEKWRLDYMTLQQEYRERREEGRLEGKIEILYTGFHMTPSQIADKLSLPESEVLRILAELQE